MRAVFFGCGPITLDHGFIVGSFLAVIGPAGVTIPRICRYIQAVGSSSVSSGVRWICSRFIVRLWIVVRSLDSTGINRFRGWKAPRRQIYFTLFLEEVDWDQVEDTFELWSLVITESEVLLNCLKIWA